MPMNDWTRVDPNDYHDFHGAWIYAIRTALNSGILPPGDFALAEHTMPPMIPDVVETARGRKVKPVGRRRVAIYHARDRQIVAVIEIVSPSNKRKKPEFADLVGKTVPLLRQGIHVLLIDPFEPSPRDPNGIHAAVWKNLTGKSFSSPADKPLTLAS